MLAITEVLPTHFVGIAIITPQIDGPYKVPQLANAKMARTL
jgi:hypothetical protein